MYAKQKATIEYEQLNKYVLNLQEMKKVYEEQKERTERHMIEKLETL